MLFRLGTHFLPCKEFLIIRSRSSHGWLNSRQAASMLMGTLICSLSGLRSSVNAWVGQVDTHSPQPMQRREFKTARSPSRVTAPIWQRSTQVPQPLQLSDSCLALNGLATSSDGLGCALMRVRIPQQQPQQQHMTTNSLELLGWRTRFALSATARILATSDRSI